MTTTYHLSTITDPHSVITAIPSGSMFPEFMLQRMNSYENEISTFQDLIITSTSSAHLLERIRTPRAFDANMRMSLLKLFRRCVSTVCDTEATKKITKIDTSVFVENYGDTFKDIAVLQDQFCSLSIQHRAALSALLGEYDKRGEQGYVLTDIFFDWVERHYNGQITIEGPRGAGKDVELSTIFPEFTGDYPCDFVLRRADTNAPVAVGFARYDSTRGGSQSDDRTGGNSDKVTKAMRFYDETGHDFKIIFLSDGPGLTHVDTWQEACTLDGQWNDNVRVVTLRLAGQKLTLDWLLS